MASFIFIMHIRFNITVMTKFLHEYSSAKQTEIRLLLEKHLDQGSPGLHCLL